MKYRYLRFPQGKAKAVTFSYDDGVRDDIRLAETCSRYGIKCTFNINSGRIAQSADGKFMTAEEIQRYILGAGHEVAVHTQWHRSPGACRPVDIIHEVMNCRLELEKMFDGIIRGMAYPDAGIRRFHNGLEYADIKRLLQDMDIAYARTLGQDNSGFVLPNDWHAWMPTAHHTNPEVMNYAQKFVQINVDPLYRGEHYPRLFYLWGHSYEFPRDDNWDVLESLCQTLGQKDDTWYATNMEIYDYVTAYHSLVLSADSKTIYNPTLHELWFDEEGALYHVKPGETIRI